MKLMVNKIGVLNAGIAKLGELKLPLKTAWAIHKISIELSEKLKFVSYEEKKIIEKYKGSVVDGNAKFVDGETANNAIMELNALHTEELDCDFEPIEIAFEDIDDCKIEPNIFTILEGVISFK